MTESLQLFEITVPVLNEENKLVDGIKRLHEYLQALYSDENWKIVIADNGSTDGTRELGEELSSKLKEVEYLRVKRAGVGLALKSVWESSNCEIVGFLDLDLATDVKHIPEAISAIYDDGYDFVYGTRLNRLSIVQDRPLYREVMSRVFNLTLKVILRTNFSDGFCGFKFLKLNKWPKLRDRGADNDGWFISPELLITAEYLNLGIYELPVNWSHGKDSRIRIIKHTIHSLVGIWRIRKRKKA